MTFQTNLTNLSEYFSYLDTLRESGRTNMFGASEWLLDEYSELTKGTSRTVLSIWMQTFDAAVDAHDRAENYINSLTTKS